MLYNAMQPCHNWVKKKSEGAFTIFIFMILHFHKKFQQLSNYLFMNSTKIFHENTTGVYRKENQKEF